jgi:membrane associated rhomboid family serine protease
MSRPGFETRYVGPRVTPLAKWVMIGVLVLYVVQVLLESWLNVPVTALLAFSPMVLEPFPYLWQILTFPFVQGDPVGLLWQELFLFMFFSQVEEMYGWQGIAKLAVTTTILGAATGQVLWGIGLAANPAPALGLGCFVMGLLVTWAMSRPDANILAMFVVPVRAIWFAWGSLLFAVLMFLRYRSVGTGAELGAWLAGYVFVAMTFGFPRGLKRTYLKYREARLKKKLGFDVIEGGAGERERPGPPSDGHVH